MQFRDAGLAVRRAKVIQNFRESRTPRHVFSALPAPPGRKQPLHTTCRRIKADCGPGTRIYKPESGKCLFSLRTTRLRTRAHTILCINAACRPAVNGRSRQPKARHGRQAMADFLFTKGRNGNNEHPPWRTKRAARHYQTACFTAWNGPFGSSIPPIAQLSVNHALASEASIGEISLHLRQGRLPPADRQQMAATRAFNAKLCAGIEKMVYLCITQAALGKLKASFLSSRLHCLCITQAALGKLKASFLSSRLHRLCKRSNNTTTKRHTRNETPHHLSSGRNGHGTGIMQ